MIKKLLRILGAIVLAAAVVAAYVGLTLAGATPFELVLATIMILLVIVVGALVLHLRALHRALFQHAQVAYKGFMLDFILAVKTLMRERREEGSAEHDLVWNLMEDYFRREADLYNTVFEELYDKTTMMHMLERGRLRKESGLPDNRPVEPLYAGLHELLTRLREERMDREGARTGGAERAHPAPQGSVR